MNAKEARTYAQKLLTVIDGCNKDVFLGILQQIHDAIDNDPSKTYIIIDIPPKQVIAWLESKEYGYETAEYRSGENDFSLKVSWAEEGLKGGYHDR